jgi:hypothetical protein
MLRSTKVVRMVAWSPPGLQLITLDGRRLGESMILKRTVLLPSYMERQATSCTPLPAASLPPSLPSTPWWDLERSKGQMTVLGAHLSLHWREPAAVLTVRPGPMFHEYFRMFAGRILTVLCPLQRTCPHVPEFNRSSGGRKCGFSIRFLYYPKTCRRSCSVCGITSPCGPHSCSSPGPDMWAGKVVLFY